MRLKRDFFLKPTEKVARDLLGKFLVREYMGKKIEGMIVETEAYLGVIDKASHSYGGKRTKRTEVMFGEAGLAYPYFVYGVHWLFNIVTSEKDDPQAVLIRMLDVSGGPAKLAKKLKIDGRLYGYDLCTADSKLYLEDRGVEIKKSEVKSLPRIGIEYAGPVWSKKRLRFVLNKKIGSSPISISPNVFQD